MLRAIKDEHSTDKGNRSTSGGGQIRALPMAPLWTTQQVMYGGERLKLFSEGSLDCIAVGGTRGTGQSFRKRVNQGSIKRTRKFGRHNTAGQTVANISSLYSCSAF